MHFQLFAFAIGLVFVQSQDLKFHPEPANDAVTNEMIDYINSLDTTWQAGKNFEGRSKDEVKKMLGVLGDPSVSTLPTQEESVTDIEIPTDFDARKKWNNCPTVSEIRDQGACGSCWAFGAVEAMSDRICIQSKGKMNAHISAEDLLSCCDQCGDGCNGGFPDSAWSYFQQTGIVTGGQYNSNQGCRPYTIKACDHHVKGKLAPCSKTIAPTPTCKRICRKGYAKKYRNDKHYGASAYSVPSNIPKIQAEIIKNGPIEATYMVYEDFLSYKSGVYQHKTGQLLGGHAVKMMGWGVDNGTPYWLIANSWNEDWGDKGVFKILRGKNECGIEAGLTAGKIKL